MKPELKLQCWLNTQLSSILKTKYISLMAVPVMFTDRITVLDIILIQSKSDQFLAMFVKRNEANSKGVSIIQIKELSANNVPDILRKGCAKGTTIKGH